MVCWGSEEDIFIVWSSLFTESLCRKKISSSFPAHSFQSCLPSQPSAFSSPGSPLPLKATITRDIQFPCLFLSSLLLLTLKMKHWQPFTERSPSIFGWFCMSGSKYFRNLPPVSRYCLILPKQSLELFWPFHSPFKRCQIYACISFNPENDSWKIRTCLLAAVSTCKHMSNFFVNCTNRNIFCFCTLFIWSCLTLSKWTMQVMNLSYCLSFCFGF